MRVLAVGNLYPPHHLGGYELVWEGAVGRLRASGHDVRVLTTDFRLPSAAAAPGDDHEVHRELRWYWRDHAFPRLGLRGRFALERHNATTLERHLDEFRPQVVSWWAMGGMSLSLIAQVRRTGTPALAFVHDDWLIYGPRVDAWTRLFARAPLLRGLVERATGLPTRFDPASVTLWLFVSAATRERALAAGRAVPASEVAHSGIDATFLTAAPAHPWRWRLLYAGRIDPRKGIRTAIEALALLPERATIDLIGAGDTAARADLEALAHRVGVSARVRFRDAVGRGQLATEYAEADAVIFPVEWQEPWGLVPLEAMGIGTPVVATGTGGSAEYLRDGDNCLLFEPGDAAGLARALERVATDEGLRARLRRGGFETAPRYTEAAFNDAVVAAVERVGAADSEAARLR